MMFQLLAFALFLILTYQCISKLRGAKEAFLALQVSPLPAWLSLLFPLGPLMYLDLVERLGVVPAGVASLLCFVPAWLLVRGPLSALQADSTDPQVQSVKEVLAKVNETALVGIAYTLMIAISEWLVVN